MAAVGEFLSRGKITHKIYFREKSEVFVEFVEMDTLKRGPFIEGALFTDVRLCLMVFLFQK